MIEEVVMFVLVFFICVSLVSAQQIVSEEYSVDSYTIGSVGDAVSDSTNELRYISLPESGGYFEGDVYGEVKRLPADAQLQIIPPSGGGGGGTGGGGGAGGGGISAVEGCVTNEDCRSGYTCINAVCYKIFEVELLEIDSPARKGEFFEFRYLVKRRLNESGEVKASYWIQSDQEVSRLAYGYDNIYLDPYGEDTSVQKVLLPRDVVEGNYVLHLLVESNNMNLEVSENIFIRDIGNLVEIGKRMNFWTVFWISFTSIVVVLTILAVIFKRKTLFLFYLWGKKIASKFYYFVKNFWKIKRRLSK
jgi:hypothetical protein